MSYLQNKFGLQGKTAIITGGGGTLCSSIAEGFANAGANIVLWDIRAEAMDAKARVITESCGDASKVACVKVDLTSEDSIIKALAGFKVY